MNKVLVTFNSVLVVGLVKLVQLKVFHFEDPFYLFPSAIGLCAWYGGSLQGILAYFLSMLMMLGLFLPSLEAMRLDEGSWLTRLLLYAVDCFVIIALCEALKRYSDALKGTVQNLSLAEKALDENAISAEKLKHYQGFLDSLIENIPNMIFVKDAKDLKFVRFNRAGEVLLGEARENLIGKSDYDLFPKSEADIFIAKDREVLRGNVVVDIPEEPLPTKDGTRYLHTKKIPIFGADGNPQYILGISEDITERKEAERQKLALLEEMAARSEAERTAARFRFLARATSALNESMDLEAMINSFASEAVSGLADCCMIDFIDEETGELERQTITCGDGLTDARSAKEQRECKKQLDEILIPEIRKATKLTGGRILSGFKMEAGSVNSVMIVKLSSYGKIFGALTFVSITSKIFTQSDLSIAEDLGRIASLAIENAKLYSQANEASRAKSAFLANMSHEIRTPLGAILGYAELSLEGDIPKEQREYISTIIRNGKQLLHIVDEILDLSKVESERISIEKITFSLPKLLDEVVCLLKLKAQERGLELSIIIPENLPNNVTADPTRLRQILINVIGNAIKFTAAGQVTIQVSSKPIRSGSKRYILTVDVKDSGIGISKEQEALLFKPFVQADGSMTRKFGGTGLGLHLSRKLARLLKGDVVLKESELEKGSHFVVTVEIELAGDIKPVDILPLFAQKPEPVQLKPSKILVVDDSTDNRLLVGYYLTKLGMQFDAAENGKVGVEKASEQDYDIIFMDLQMPEMDGFQALRLLRNKKYRKPVIALTAHAMKGDKERCLEAGFDDYLCKPLTKDSVRKSLEINLI
jgi:PAS domain S-box-containing protein